MGDRANVLVLQYGAAPPITLYSHWGGDEFLRACRDAITDETRRQPNGESVRSRVGDPSYFTKLLIAAVQDQISGISTGLGDTSDRPNHILVIDSTDGSHWWVTSNYALHWVGVASMVARIETNEDRKVQIGEAPKFDPLPKRAGA